MIKNTKKFVIYFTRYILKKLIKMLSVRYHELMGKIEEPQGKKLFGGW